MNDDSISSLSQNFCPTLNKLPLGTDSVCSRLKLSFFSSRGRRLNWKPTENFWESTGTWKTKDESDIDNVALWTALSVEVAAAMGGREEWRKIVHNAAKKFPVGWAQDTWKPSFFTLAPPSVETSRIFHDCSVRYSHMGLPPRLCWSVNWSYGACSWVYRPITKNV